MVHVGEDKHLSKVENRNKNLTRQITNIHKKMQQKDNQRDEIQFNGNFF